MLDPGAQFQWERISSAVQPCRSLRGSEMEPTTSSRYSSFRCRERSLDPGRLQRAARHSRTNAVFPISLRRPSAFGSDWRQGKVRLTFRLYTVSPVKDRPKYCKSFSKPVALQIRHTQTLVVRTLDADLSTDHRPSAFPKQSEQGSLKRQPMCLR